WQTLFAKSTPPLDRLASAVALTCVYPALEFSNCPLKLPPVVVADSIALPIFMMRTVCAIGAAPLRTVPPQPKWLLTMEKGPKPRTARVSPSGTRTTLCSMRKAGSPASYTGEKTALLALLRDAPDAEAGAHGDVEYDALSVGGSTNRIMIPARTPLA